MVMWADFVSADEPSSGGRRTRSALEHDSSDTERLHSK